MQDHFIVRTGAFGLAALVVLSLLSGLDRLAVHEHAATALAEGRATPALVAAGELPGMVGDKRVAASAPVAMPS